MRHCGPAHRVSVGSDRRADKQVEVAIAVVVSPGRVEVPGRGGDEIAGGDPGEWCGELGTAGAGYQQHHSNGKGSLEPRDSRAPSISSGSSLCHESSLASCVYAHSPTQLRDNWRHNVPWIAKRAYHPGQTSRKPKAPSSKPENARRSGCELKLVTILQAPIAPAAADRRGRRSGSRS
jgi:hypothetical protein